MGVIQVKIGSLALALALWLLPLTKGGYGRAAVTSVSKYRASQYRELGLSYQQQGRYPEAITAMKKSVEFDPGNITGRVNLGWAQHLVGQEDAAQESLVQALYREPRSIPALNALGIVYLVSGYLASAVVVHTWAAVLKPDDEIAYYNLSLAFQRLRLYDSAIKTATRAAALEPNNPHPFLALAIAHWNKGERTLAKKAYRQALNLDSRYSDRAILAYLKKAGFSSDQIRTTQLILSAQRD